MEEGQQHSNLQWGSLGNKDMPNNLRHLDAPTERVYDGRTRKCETLQCIERADGLSCGVVRDVEGAFYAFWSCPL